jgi:hypothetical protein
VSEHPAHIEGPSDLGLPAEWWGRLGHDLRGPLGPIRMAVQLLRNERAAERERNDALQVIERQVDRLLVEIDDAADLLRMRNGIYALRALPGDLNLVLDPIGSRVTLLRALAERDQALECQARDEEVVAAYDPARLCGLLEFVLRKLAAVAPRGAVLRLGIDVGDPSPALVVTGHDASAPVDAELAWLAGASGVDPHDVGIRAALMREIARRSGVRLDQDVASAALRLRIPAVTAPA